ncbi:MAG TPA: 16S rRNA (adenine(1518)-N(6)/adenine(1519)-N(6))-dimethyltransferase RsmA [Candidatus Goldiibacteriota bacterium]|nr:16S rRNA (adenine(1518)-N(6)/adenine(1519)-N(6))-dimethyltransferase RsmA [Candidatus Goldiibacteriota bacterium]
MDQKKFKYKKRLGQNFLHNTSKLGQMAAIISARPGETVIEIGPGAGALTKELIKTAGRVIAVELDPEAIDKLKKKLGEPDNLEIINADFLKLDIKGLCSKLQIENCKLKIAGNIPYYITAPIIEKLIDNKRLISKAWLTVQKEVGDRMAAKEGSKTYGSLSVFCQFHANVKKLLKIDRTSFFPVPEVDSAFMELDFEGKRPLAVKDEKLFFRIVHAGFGQRRKMLINNVKRETGIGAAEALSAFCAAGIPEKARAEDVSIDTVKYCV